MEGSVAIPLERCVRRARLTYVTDAARGIVRRLQGEAFAYVGRNGRAISNPKTLERIAALAIPPAWTDVWICTDADGHIQATGRDQRGRKQYRYHTRWTESRDEVKYGSLAAFARALPKVRERLDHDLSLRGMPREKALAAVVWLLDNTMIRVGNAAYARDNKSFGLTTLKNRHLEVEGSRLRFSFKGKSGKEWALKLTDRRIARVLKSIQDLPGQDLFQYLDAEGVRRRVRSQDVNDYIREAGGEAFSSKHFRTWGGTVRALSILSALPVPETKTARQRELNAAVDSVAGKLGNTRAVCRRCYIHPGVVTAWEEGRLAKETQRLGRRQRKGLDVTEALTLVWLETCR